MTTCHYINSGQSNFEYKYLGEFENEFKNILGHESGAQVCLFDGKKQRSKSRATVPLISLRSEAKNSKRKEAKRSEKKNLFFT